ncbi:hypothetical protein HanIR_Chr12g0598941 [Helianthus annuus]|nr:hypothetical protein HanIR_Chr12g0598941 [Helianthus annuus]
MTAKVESCLIISTSCIFSSIKCSEPCPLPVFVRITYLGCVLTPWSLPDATVSDLFAVLPIIIMHAFFP